jgi:hypothetical protein
MVPMLIFGILGGLVSAVVALQFGFLAALLAYVIGGSLFALIPGLLRLRDKRSDHARHEESSATEPAPSCSKPHEETTDS